MRELERRLEVLAAIEAVESGGRLPKNFLPLAQPSQRLRQYEYCLGHQSLENSTDKLGSHTTEVCRWLRSLGLTLGSAPLLRLRSLNDSTFLEELRRRLKAEEKLALVRARAG